MARILSRRADGAPPPMPEPTEASATGEPAAAVPAEGDQPTEVLPAAERSPALEATGPVETASAADVHTRPSEGVAAPESAAADDVTAVPAGADGVPAASPTFLTRGKLRRRLRYLRRVREIGFRDLGGLVFDLDRFGRERPDLVELKLAGLKSIDAELRTLEAVLADLRDGEELFEPGISACVRCGALHGSEARFCPSCGAPIDASEAPSGGEQPATAPEGAPDSSTQSEQPAA